jgi:tetratricopeptide (TPR) repeat protein
MTAKCGVKPAKILAASLLVLVLALGLAGSLDAQTVPGSPKQPTTTAPAPGGQQTPELSKDNALALDNAPPVNAEEDAAFKDYQDAPIADANKKIALGEAFSEKYSASRYLPAVYSSLTVLYLQSNQLQKMEEVGDKEVKLTPNDVQTLAILGQSIPRSMKRNSAADTVKELSKAEDYAKRAIDITPMIAKPENLSDEQFASAKNVTLAMAHSGLGLVYLDRGKYADAIPELEQSVRLDPTPDAVNYYLLGLANQKASHFEDAVAAYTRCAAMPGTMQARCKDKAEEAKKSANTQLSIPK